VKYELLVRVESAIVGAIAGGKAGDRISNQVNNQADLLQNIDNQALEIVGLMPGNQVSTIASGIAGNQIEVLKQCVNANIKEIILSAIKLSNQSQYYVEYVKTLVDINWLTMTNSWCPFLFELKSPLNAIVCIGFSN